MNSKEPHYRILYNGVVQKYSNGSDIIRSLNNGRSINRPPYNTNTTNDLDLDHCEFLVNVGEEMKNTELIHRFISRLIFNRTVHMPDIYESIQDLTINNLVFICEHLDVKPFVCIQSATNDNYEIPYFGFTPRSEGRIRNICYATEEESTLFLLTFPNAHVISVKEIVSLIKTIKNKILWQTTQST